MGAYANPQEIEGQFDATQNQRNIQHMFDTITSSAEKNSSRLSEIYAARAKKNAEIIKEANQKQLAGDTKINSELAGNDTGIDFSYLKKAPAENARLNAMGVRSEEDNKTLAETAAVPDSVHDNLAIVHVIQTSTSKAFSFDEGSPGAIDMYASDPGLLELGQAFRQKDGKKINLDWGKKSNDKVDFSTTIASLKNENGSTPYDLKKIRLAFEGNSDYGITFIPNPVDNITKIQNQAKAENDGSGIFIMKDNEFTGKVSDSYLDFNKIDDNPKKVSKTSNGGVNRIDKVAINKSAIAPLILDKAQAVVKGNMEKPNSIPSLYNYFTLEQIEKQKKGKYKTVKGDRDLLQEEVYHDIGTVPNGDKPSRMDYTNASIFTEEVKQKLAWNQRASVLNALPDYQETGVAYYVGPRALKLEDKKEITAKSDPEAFKILTTKISDPKSFKEGDSQIVTFDIGKESSYKVKLSKTKSGFKFRVIGNNTGENNQQ